MKPSAKLAILVTLAVTSTAHAQMRAAREPFDFTGLGVVVLLLALGVGAYYFAVGRKRN